MLWRSRETSPFSSWRSRETSLPSLLGARERQTLGARERQARLTLVVYEVLERESRRRPKRRRSGSCSGLTQMVLGRP